MIDGGQNIGCVERRALLPMRRCQCGMTLIEVVLGLSLIVGLLVAVVMSMSLGSSFNMAAAQNVAAFSQCRARIERMRATNYMDIATNNFPATTVDLGYTGRKRLVLQGVLTNKIVEVSNPTRKNVEVGVVWKYRDLVRTQRLHGVIYYKR